MLGFHGLSEFALSEVSTLAVAVTAVQPSGGWIYPNPRADAFRQLQLIEKRAELRRIDDELAEAEKRRLAAIKRSNAKLVAENAAKKLAALEAMLQEEINKLRIERAWLMRLINDEETMLVLLLSWPLH